MSTLPEGPVEEVAKRLLGARLRTEFDGLATEVMLTEVEAYGGTDDPASHAFGGVGERNRAMFGPAGTLYVYRSYGVHWCANVVTGPVGVGEAILLRAGVPTEGEETMQRRRGRADHLCDGPGKLCQALGITGSQDGTSLFEGPVRLRLPAAPPSQTVLATGRVGISKAKERPWRFTILPFS
ncbi:MAG: DNA-3-methyladenine glycosylase [Actinobacteria bacterium]|nr:DNA-3-methyladenine glycosylase [Actinomycetota bacterium]